MADFWSNLRAVLGGPTTIAADTTGNIGARARNEYTPVYGFEQDKANYGNERDGSKLKWRSVTAHNNDTDKDIVFDVGYDSDGRISGVRRWDGDDDFGYYGQDLVGDFFKKNFDRDATDYTIYDNINSGDGYKYVIFDSKNDGSFIPSIALNSQRGSEGVPYAPNKIDSESDTLSDWLRRYRIDKNTRGRTLFSQEDESKKEAAERGHLEAYDMHYMPKAGEEMEFFERNSDGFAGMAMEFSRTPDANVRKQILQDAYEKYGSLPKFRKYLNVMMADEEAHEKGAYDDYDYRRVGKDISEAINDVYDYYYRHA